MFFEPGEPGVDAGVLGKLVGSQQLEQPEEAVRVVVERRGAQEEHVASKRRDRRHRAPSRIATRRSTRPP